MIIQIIIIVIINCLFKKNPMFHPSMRIMMMREIFQFFWFFITLSLSLLNFLVHKKAVVLVVVRWFIRFFFHFSFWCLKTIYHYRHCVIMCVCVIGFFFFINFLFWIISFHSVWLILNYFAVVYQFFLLFLLVLLLLFVTIDIVIGLIFLCLWFLLFNFYSKFAIQLYHHIW